MSEPSAQDVEAFCSVTTASQSVATQFLHQFPNLETAIGQYYENHGILPKNQTYTDRRYSWDEGSFHADRDQQYGPENRPSGSFNIQGADALGPGVFDASPSRPPSRVSTHAVYDSTVNTGADQKAGGVSSIYRSDQELGVLDTSGQRFRRIDDDYYDAQNWQVTLPRFETREYLQGPAPKDRVRQRGAPAFLKPAISAQYLPALLTILHTIPMAREALIARDISLADYGANSEWWDGDSIQSSRVIVLDRPEEGSRGSNLVYEVQRLMAFLDMTERAYGSANNLVLEPAVSNVYSGLAANFLKAWRNEMAYAESTTNLCDIFTSLGVNDSEDAMNDSVATTELTEFEVSVTQRVAEFGGTLYDAIDEAFWPETDDTDPLWNVHVRFGEIITVRVINRRNGAQGLEVEAPKEFYPDRYMENLVETMKPMRAQRIKLITEHDRITENLRNLSTLTDLQDFSTVHSGIELLERAMSHFSQFPDRQSAVTKPPQPNDSLVDVDEDAPRVFSHAQTAAELRSLLERIAVKYDELQQAKKSLYAQFRTTAFHYRGRSTHPDPSNLHRYTLRGFSTDPSTTFVLQEQPPSPEDELVNLSSTEPVWWKLGYDGSSDAPVVTVPITEADAFRALGSESTEVMLVYASDAAMQFPIQPLPPRLRNFVRVDNLAFGRELEQAEASANGTNKDEWDAAGGGRATRNDDDGWRTEDNGTGWDGVVDQDQANSNFISNYPNSGRETPINITISDDGIDNNGDNGNFGEGGTEQQVREADNAEKDKTTGANYDGIPDQPPPYDEATSGRPAFVHMNDVKHMGDIDEISMEESERSAYRLQDTSNDQRPRGSDFLAGEDARNTESGLFQPVNIGDQGVDAHPLYRTNTRPSIPEKVVLGAALESQKRQTHQTDGPMQGVEWEERKGG